MNERLLEPDTDLVERLGLEGKRGFWTWGRALAAAILLAAAIAGAGWYVLGRTSGPLYVTAEIRRGPLTVTVSATGTLEPESEVNVGPEISGRIDAVNVDYNDPVHKGQVLAVINTDQLRAQLAQARAASGAARASVMTSEATLNESRLRRDRARALYARGGISQQDLQSAEADYARAEASLAKARADVENAAAQVASIQTTIGKAEILSPIDGIVLDRNVEPGQAVAASFQTPVLFTLASDLTRMQLVADIDEADIGQVRAGQTATFTVDAYPQRRFTARLISLRNAPQVESGVVTYQGIFTVDNKDGLLRPGLTATVDILVAEVEDALLVPNGALRFTPAAEAATTPPLEPATNGEAVGRVWVLEGTKPVLRDLTIGPTDGQMTEVLSGDLEPGDRVIVDTAARTPRA